MLELAFGKNICLQYAKNCSRMVCFSGSSVSNRTVFQYCSTFLEVGDSLDQGSTIIPNAVCIKYAFRQLNVNSTLIHSHTVTSTTTL
jgi:hypothetical protein